MSELSLLFSPLEIRGMKLRNRINMAPMVTNYATIRGEVTDRLIGYYATRSHGGAGLITVEATVVSASGRSFTHNLCIYDDYHTAGLRRLTDAVHEGGAKITVEIYHAGRRTTSAIARSHPVAPSAIPAKGGEVPWELSIGDIETIQNDFTQAARRAKEAGFDAVTLHAGHGYLINAFLSPHSNKRQDGYGGSPRARARFGLEILKRVRAEVGDEFPVLCRLTANEFVEGGLRLEDAQQIAGWLEEGGVDAIDVSAGTIETAYMTNLYMMFPRGIHVPLAAGIREKVSVPVFAVGRINDPLLAEKILAEGKADGITMGRALIADPELPNKARDGRVDEITPCIACLQGCTDRLQAQLDIACLVNPAAGREQYIRVAPARVKKRVLVVGGGIAGMEAAWVARQRGHSVELHERGSQLGGQFLLAGAAPGKEEIYGLVRFLSHRVEHLGVDVHTGSDVTPKKIREIGPDAVIVATGAQPMALRVPGAELAVRSWDVLAGKARAGYTVVVIGGGQVGCETAEYLAERGSRVTILEMLPDVALDMGARAREPFLDKLVSLGVNIITLATVTAIGEEEVSYDRAGLFEKLTGVDTVVIATGSRADRALGEALAEAPFEVHVVGDCVKARRGMEAVHEGFAAGAAI